MARWVFYDQPGSGCHFLKKVFNQLTYFKGEKELYEKENSSVIHKYENKNWSSPSGAERRPFRTEARKCNHLAADRLRCSRTCDKIPDKVVHCSRTGGLDRLRRRLINISSQKNKIKTKTREKKK